MLPFCGPHRECLFMECVGKYICGHSHSRGLVILVSSTLEMTPHCQYECACVCVCVCVCVYLTVCVGCVWREVCGCLAAQGASALNVGGGVGGGVISRCVCV